MAGTVRRYRSVREGIRPFPPTAYPPPSPWSPRREGKKETWTEIKQKEGGTEGRNTPKNCLRFCFTSRGYLSIAFIDFSH